MPATFLVRNDTVLYIPPMACPWNCRWSVGNLCSGCLRTAGRVRCSSSCWSHHGYVVAAARNLVWLIYQPQPHASWRYYCHHNKPCIINWDLYGSRSPFASVRFFFFSSSSSSKACCSHVQSDAASAIPSICLFVKRRNAGIVLKWMSWNFFILWWSIGLSFPYKTKLRNFDKFVIDGVRYSMWSRCCHGYKMYSNKN